MRAAILSDIHSNHMALERVVRDARAAGVAEFWCLGDVVNYGWQPVEVLQELQPLVRAENWIMGNHDALYAGIVPTKARPFGQEARLMMNHNRRLIQKVVEVDPGLKAFLDDRFSSQHQPPKRKDLNGMTCFLTHSGFDWEEYYYPWFDERPLDPWIKKLFEQLEDYPTPTKGWKFWESGGPHMRLLFLGHTHLPSVSYAEPESGTIKTIKVRCGKIDLSLDCQGSKIIVINPGSVGFPKDRLPSPCYVILDTRKKTLEFRRVSEYQSEDFIAGYEPIGQEIEQYLTEDLRKDGIGNTDALKLIDNIRNEIRHAPRPHFERVPEDWRKFYEGSNCRDR